MKDSIPDSGKFLSNCQLSSQKANELRNIYFPGWFMLQPANAEEKPASAYYRVICSNLYDFNVAFEVKPPGINADIVLRLVKRH